MTTMGTKRGKLTPDDLAAAKRLRAAWDVRANPKMSQYMAADVMGMTQSAVNQYLNGKIPLGLEAVTAFSDLLGVDPVTIRPDMAADFSKLRRTLSSSGPLTSHPPRLDRDTLAAAVGLLNTTLRSMGGALGDTQYGHFLCEIYDLLRDNEKAVPGKVVEIAAYLARRNIVGATGDVRSSTSGPSGEPTARKRRRRG